MSLETWFIYLLATLLLSLTPGPNGLLSLSHGVLHGARRTLFTVLGSVTGFALLMGLSMLGLGALLMASETLFSLVKWLGACYLIYLGIRTWRAAPLALPHPMAGGAEHRQRPARLLFSQGFLVAISNPKVILFFTAFLPQFIDPTGSQGWQFLIMALTFTVTEFSVEMLLAGGAQRITPWLGRRGHMGLFNRISGGTFIGAGAFLLSMER
jgi:threonine/homoserine/homoserine lactone efflux protein